MNIVEKPLPNIRGLHLKACDGVNLVAVGYGKGTRLDTHMHREAQLVYAAKGTMQVTTPKGRWLVPPDRAVWVPARLEHAIDVLADIEMRTLYFDLAWLTRETPRMALDAEFVVRVSRLLHQAILALFRAAPTERIDRHSDWFTLRDAQLHIRPYTWPYPEISTAAMISPSGPRLAGALGTSLLSLSMSVPGGYAALETTWDVVRQQAAKAGRDEPDRSDWRVLSIMHIADSRDRAIDDCTYGLLDFAQYFGAAGFVPLANAVDGAQSPREYVEDYAAKGNCCIGTPDDAIAYIEDLLDRSGGFGTLLMLGHDWASPEATYHCYDLFARKVIPHFKGQLEAPRASHDWARDRRDQLIGRAGEAVVKAITEHVEEHKTEAK